MKLDETLAQLEKTLELYFGKKAPPMPQNIKEVLVNIGPWILLVLLILSLPGMFALFGIGAVLGPLGLFYGSGYGYMALVSALLLIVIIVLEVKALPGLFKREKKSWQLVYYAALIGLVQNLLLFNLLGFIVGGALSMYILFQIKSFYK